MTCADCRPELLAYLDHELGPAELSALEAHLSGCPDCRAALEAEQLLSGALGSLAAVNVPPDFEARFWARVAREREAPAGWGAWLKRRGLAFGGLAAVALAIVLALRNRAEPDVDPQIVANAEDFEMLEDPDLELIEVADMLEVGDGDQG